jgi:4-hydroxy-tetrahydrodipicolinate reductase
MNISLIGYGKMGKEIEKLCRLKGHNIYSVVDPLLGTGMQGVIGSDLAIEFTQPASAVNNIRYCLEHGVPVVSGTTGWQTSWEEIKNYCLEQNGTLFHSSNFSIGVQLFWRVSAYIARLMDPYKDYALSIHEIHHEQKKDAPSGTAVSLAEAVLGTSGRFTSWVGVEKQAYSFEQEIPVSSERTGQVPGTHILEFKGKHDKMVWTHEAFSRAGFVEGVVVAAEWLLGKKGVYGMDDLFSNT